ncbi:hypothetical protein V6N11_073351 [Hibiscus sabdariffa]|uniref:Reverse transcriptase zinc-binding domain-containing protein n=2 Tax=Hibiscus sabdariffa TaxID=183260 RepID=A0ABR1Z710_9ROSI
MLTRLLFMMASLFVIWLLPMRTGIGRCCISYSYLQQSLIFFNIHCPYAIIGAYRLFWRPGKHDHFSIKSAYDKLCELTWNPYNSKWLLIWRLSVPECVRHFLWLSVHNSILFNLGRYRRSFTIDPSCSVLRCKRRVLPSYPTRLSGY